MNCVMVGSVNLDAVETGFSSQQRSVSKAPDQFLNLVRCHCSWRLCTRAQRCDRGRRTQAFLTDQLGFCDAAPIIDLEDRKATCCTHRFGEAAQTGQVSVMCRTYSLPGASVVFDVSGRRNDSSESAGSTTPDEFELALGHRSIFMGRIGCQRRDRKPVCHLSSAVEP